MTSPTDSASGITETGNERCVRRQSSHSTASNTASVDTHGMQTDAAAVKGTLELGLEKTPGPGAGSKVSLSTAGTRGIPRSKGSVSMYSRKGSQLSDRSLVEPVLFTIGGRSRENSVAASVELSPTPKDATGSLPDTDDLPQDVDRGWAWVILVAVFLWNFATGGTLKIYGVLYLELLELFQAGPVVTSWIGFAYSICCTVMLVVGGFVQDNLSSRRTRFVVLVACLLAPLALVLSGWMPAFIGTLLTFGLVTGSSAGICHPAILSLLGTYFHKRRALASGLAFSGTTLASLVLPPAMTLLVEAYSLRGAMMVFGAIWLHVLICPAAMPSRHKENYDAAAEKFEKSRLTSGQSLGLHEVNTLLHRINTSSFSVKREFEQSKGIASRRHISVSFNVSKNKLLQNYSFLKNADVMVMSVVLFSGFFGYYNTFFVFPQLAREMSMTKLTGSLLVTLPSVTEIVFRPLLGFIVDKEYISKVKMLNLCYFLSGAIILLMAFIPNRTELTSLCLATAFGIFGGMVVPLSLPTLMDKVTEDHYGGIVGLVIAMVGLTTGSGPPILTVVAKSSETFGTSLQICGSMYFFGIICCAIGELRSFIRYKNTQEKVYPA